MSGEFQVLSHTADTAIEVTAESLGELFEWAALGMFATMYDTAGQEPERYVTVAARGSHIDEMLVDILSDLLYLSEAEDIAPCTFRADEVAPTAVGLSVGVVPVEPEMLVGPPIKAVTYHDLSVAKDASGTWRARVVFDV